MKQLGTPATLYRGGTSRALFVHQADLPTTDTEQLHQWIRSLFGSPDRRQIDGIGGGDLLTSKFAIVGPSTHPAADLDYSFFQVGIGNNSIATDLACGNISAAVAPFAVQRGIVDLPDGDHTITIHNTNHGNLIDAHVKIADGEVEHEGSFVNEGVPGTGYPIGLDFRHSVGGRTGSLLPTGSVIDSVIVDGLGEIDCTVVDLGNLIAFVRASDFGLSGAEDPLTLQHNTALMAQIEAFRGSVAARLGFASSPPAAAAESPGTPWVSLVASPSDWVAFGTGETRSAHDCDLLARGFSLGLAHKAYWGTGSICTGVAAALPGSIVHDVYREARKGVVRIGHPSGVAEVEAIVDPVTFEVAKGSLFRTARKIMDGIVYTPVPGR